MLIAQEKLYGLHGSTYPIRFVFVRHHIIQFEWILFCLGLSYKQCQAQDLLNSVFYIAAKPKQTEMMLPTIKLIFINNIGRF